MSIIQLYVYLVHCFSLLCDTEFFYSFELFNSSIRTVEACLAYVSYAFFQKTFKRQHLFNHLWKTRTISLEDASGIVKIPF